MRGFVGVEKVDVKLDEKYSAKNKKKSLKSAFKAFFISNRFSSFPITSHCFSSKNVISQHKFVRFLSVDKWGKHIHRTMDLLFSTNIIY